MRRIGYRDEASVQQNMRGLANNGGMCWLSHLYSTRRGDCTDSP